MARDTPIHSKYSNALEEIVTEQLRLLLVYERLYSNHLKEIQKTIDKSAEVSEKARELLVKKVEESSGITYGDGMKFD